MSKGICCTDITARMKTFQMSESRSVIIQVNPLRKHPSINTTHNEEITWKACTAPHNLTKQHSVQAPVEVR